MAITNYATLQSAIANWLHRSDLTTTIPDFIALAESRINRVFSARGAEIDVTLTATVDSAFVDLPVDFSTPIGLWLESFVPRRLLVFKQPTELAYVPVKTYPNFWAIKDGQIQFDRIAAGNYPLTLRYKKNSNIATTDTNYILSSYPDLYLFGALVEAAIFIRDTEQMQIWQQKFDNAMTEAQCNENGAKDVLLATENMNKQRFSIVAG